MSTIRSLVQFLLGKRLPITQGQIKVDGVEAPIRIRRDGYGVPYITAQGDADAWFGLGFCHGQDRAFQLEMIYRICRGTTAELVGPATLAMDRFSRRLGFHRVAKQELPLIEQPYRDLMEAYVRGVNAGRKEGLKKKPHEFVFLRGEPIQIEMVDLLAYGRYMGLHLSFWSSKLTRFLILLGDGPEAVSALSPSYPDWQLVTRPVGTQAGIVANRLADELAQMAGVFDSVGASNNWALNGSHTATGRPLLANDPHLGSILPPQWYLAHLQTPDWTLAGATFSGGGVFPSAHNDKAAWGVTAGLVDNIDLYLEEIGPDGRMVRDVDGWVECELVEEVIQVKGAEPVTEKVLITPRGPIISPALEGVDAAISMRATWMQPQPSSSFFPLARVDNFEEFCKTVFDVPPVCQNWVYADTDDGIGWQISGRVPRRRGAYGTIPLPGYDPAAAWEDETLPLDEMPHLFNPPGGLIATANTKPQQDGDGPYLGSDWIDGYRLGRILEVLESRKDWDIEGMKALQVDTVSLPWREMKEVVLAAPADHPDTQLALDLLGKWNGVVATDSPAAAVYEYFLSEMAGRMVDLKAPGSFEYALGKGWNPLTGGSSFPMMLVALLSALLREQPEGWFEDAWLQEVSIALRTAVRRIRGNFGEDIDAWAWGEVRPLTLNHPLGGMKPLDQVFNVGPLPFGGDSQTVMQAGRSLADPAQGVGSIANLRMAVDVGNWGNNSFVLAGGQSGNPFSPHYKDLFSLWRRGEGHTLAWGEEAIAKATVATLELLPK